MYMRYVYISLPILCTFPHKTVDQCSLMKSPRNVALLNQKYHASANSSPDPFPNQSAFRKLANNQSQVLKKDQASLSATL